jgi:hypothetical protein
MHNSTGTDSFEMPELLVALSIILLLMSTAAGVTLAVLAHVDPAALEGLR